MSDLAILWFLIHFRWRKVTGSRRERLKLGRNNQPKMDQKTFLKQHRPFASSFLFWHKSYDHIRLRFHRLFTFFNFFSKKGFPGVFLFRANFTRRVIGVKMWIKKNFGCYAIFVATRIFVSMKCLHLVYHESYDRLLRITIFDSIS